MRQARLQPRPRWYQNLVTLIDVMMATCTQATYDANEVEDQPGRVYTRGPCQRGSLGPCTSETKQPAPMTPPVMEDAPETPAPAQPARREQEDEKVQQAEALPLQELRKPPDEKPVDPLFSSDSDDVLIMDTEKAEPESLASPTALISSNVAKRCGFHPPLLPRQPDRARQRMGRTPRGRTLRRAPTTGCARKGSLEG